MNPYLLPSIEFGPVVVERLLNSIPAAQIDHRGDPDRFTVREILAHLADWEPILRDRMQRTLAEEGYVMTVFDEGELALQNNYSEKDPKNSLKAWREERRKTAEFLRSLKADDFEKSGLHPERGSLSVSDQGSMLLGHDLYHIEQLSSIQA